MFKRNESPRSASGRGLKWVVAGVSLALAAGVGFSAWARAEHGQGMGMFMGPPGMMAGRHLDHMLDTVKATDAQRTQIHQIADAAFADLKAQRDAGRGLHEQAMQAFTATNVEANAVEALRQQMLQQHDQASKRVMQAMLDVSRVLTPEQRTQLAQHMKQRADSMREHMGRHEHDKQGS